MPCSSFHVLSFRFKPCRLVGLFSLHPAKSDVFYHNFMLNRAK